MHAHYHRVFEPFEGQLLTGSPPASLHVFCLPPKDTFLHVHHVTFQRRTFTLIQCYCLIFRAHSNFTNCPPHVFLLSGPWPIQECTLPLGSLLQSGGAVPQSFLFIHALDYFKKYRPFILWGDFFLSDFSFWLFIEALCSGQKFLRQGAVLFSEHHTREQCHPVPLVVMVT